MPITIKQNLMKYKSDRLHKYVGINSVAERATADQIEDIEAAGADTIAEVNAAIEAGQTAIDGIETQKNQMIASIAQVAGQGTDATFTQQGVAADAKAVGDLKSALNSFITFVADANTVEVLNGCYVNTGSLDGSTLPNAKLNVANYVNVSDYLLLYFTAPVVNGNAGVAFYDADSHFIRGSGHAENGNTLHYRFIALPVPTNAKYARFTFFSGNDGAPSPDGFKVYGYLFDTNKTKIKELKYLINDTNINRGSLWTFGYRNKDDGTINRTGINSLIRSTLVDYMPESVKLCKTLSETNLSICGFDSSDQFVGYYDPATNTFRIDQWPTFMLHEYDIELLRTQFPNYKFKLTYSGPIEDCANDCLLLTSKEEYVWDRKVKSAIGATSLATTLQNLFSVEKHFNIINDTGSHYWPWLIRVDDKISNPLGKYYLYYSSDHSGTDGAVYLAYTNDLVNYTLVGQIFKNGNYETETPSVVWSPDLNKFIMYFHSYNSYQGEAQTTFFTMSTDGITFDQNVTKAFDLDKNRLYGDLHNGYFKPFKIGGKWVGYSLMGGGDTNVASAVHYSDDGLHWVTDHNQLNKIALNGLNHMAFSSGTLIYRNNQLYFIGVFGTAASGIAQRTAYVGIVAMNDLYDSIGYPFKLFEFDNSTYENTNVRGVSVFQVDTNLLVYYQCDNYINLAVLSNDIFNGIELGGI